MLLLSAAGLSFLAYPLYASAAETTTSDYPYLTSPPVFPAPNATGAGGWADAYSKADEFVAKLNLTEKAGLVTGYLGGGCIANIAAIPRLGFRGICLQDGPNGVRTAGKTTVFPAGLTTGATWDKDVFYQRGVALGDEFKAKGVNVHLGPVAGPLGRHALGGRNWETFSPDPYLTGVAMAETIKGLQDTGVQACAKHFVGNEQETNRGTDGAGVVGDAISSNIDDRTLHELYLWPFADSVRAGVATVMCSYNKLNQTYSCENSKILNGVLKTELGFQGPVISDWFATHSGIRAIEAGLDVNMPGPLDSTDAYSKASYFGQNITLAVSNGTLSETRLDDMIRRLLTPYFLFNQDSDDYPTVDESMQLVLVASYDQLQTILDINGGAMPDPREVRGNHADLARQWAAAGTVLLKNTNATLPLRSPANLGVFGNDAPDVSQGPISMSNFEEGTLVIGGGAGGARLSSVVSPLSALKSRAERDGTYLQYITSNAKLAAGEFTGIYPIPDTCIVFLKTWAQEAEDRTSYEPDWNATAVVDNVAAFCPRTVVVTHSGGVNSMPWAANPNVSAILAAHYPGQESGGAIVDVLYGDVNPSGRLPYTIAREEGDYVPIVNGSELQANFEEGLMIDYRAFDVDGIEPLYEFGFGLSYTTFDIDGDLAVEKLAELDSPYPAPATTISPGGNADLWTPVLNVSTQVANTGDAAGAVVVQLYVSYPEESAPEGTPVRVLRGFTKASLEVGEGRAVDFSLTRRDLSIWDVGAQDWRVLSGEYEISVGLSSRDLRRNGTVTLF